MSEEIKHCDPEHCDVCFLLLYIYSLSQGSYPQKEVKERLFKMKRKHTSHKEMVKLE